MTEPVAYLQLDIHGKEMVHIEKDMKGYETTPLYTTEDLHPRVKMTKTEFVEWKDLYNRSVMFSEAIEITDLDYSYNYENIKKKIWVGNRENNIENEAIFARLYADFNPDNPEETIEIVPNMKWFVQMKNENEKTRFLHKNLFDRNHVLNYGSLKYYAKHFDTKEEAELWTTPDTEAVQLPVEEQQ